MFGKKSLGNEEPVPLKRVKARTHTSIFRQSARESLVELVDYPDFPYN